MGLCYVTSRWADKLWQGHVKATPTAQQLVSQGQAKQGQDFEGFAQDLHSRLYLHNEPHKLDGGPSWAEDLHNAANELSEWQQLKARCRHNGFTAGVATEAILNSLIDQIPDEPQSDDDDSELPYTDQPGVPGNGDGKPVAWTDKGEAENGAELRRKLRKAIREARDQVVEMEATLDGLQEPLGMKRPGTQIGEQVTYKDIEKIREAHDTIKSSYNLRRIAELAGRLTRMADNEKKTKVRGTIGAVKGVELSGDIARILPGELAGLRGSKLERLLTLGKIVERRALSYKMESTQTEGRGPIVVCEDLSSSMEGSRDLWAKACALAILTTATRQKRDWTFLGFDARIRHEDHIAAGAGDAKVLERALSHAPHGGTRFDPPVRRACEIIATSETMRKADVIIITDGEADLDEANTERIKSLTETEGVQVYVIAIGNEAQAIRHSDLGKVATKVAYISTTQNTDPVVFEAINLEVV